ncbi:MAG: hypothetical protein IJQ85_09040 [Selenomonadaceae bacterium]|nr:hypothetical protein [Selenomonadaceae bacterium]
MKIAAKILAGFAIIILFSSTVEAARHIKPPFVRRTFLPPMRTPQKEYFPRQPFRPKPHYLPRVPKPTYDNRGGRRKNFGPPQAPHR